MIGKTVLSAAAMAAALTLITTAAAAENASNNASAQSGRQITAPLMRYPTVHDNTVVFEAGGNLWKTSIQGGTATRLTADPGFDQDAHFSPNGKWIAFTGGYQGNTDVYIVPAKGGKARRLTFHSINTPQGSDELKPSTDNRVLGWTPDSKHVVFLSRRDSFNPQVMHAYTVPVKGGLPKQLPIPWTGPLSFGGNDHTVAYNQMSRIYRPYHRKTYYGGQAQDIWTFDFKTGESHRITHWKGADVWPMWSGHTIYFTSDRGPKHIQNLWAYSQNTHKFKQLTHFTTYNVHFPTLGGQKITFSNAGDLYVYDTPHHKLKKLDVEVPLDGRRAMPHWAKAKGHVRSSTIAPNGKLALFSARGALFTVGVKHGDTTKLTHDPAADQRVPAWSPNGKKIAYIGAKGQHNAVYVRPATGGQPKALTHTNDISYHGPITWSPNSQFITYVDSNQTLWLANVSKGTRRKVARDPSQIKGNFSDLNWSPGSQWLAFSKPISKHIGNMTVPNTQAIYLYHVSSGGTLTRIGEGLYDDYDPVFSDDGKYLFFVSNRIVNPTFSNFDEMTAGLKSSGLYVATLKKSTKSPIAPRVVSATQGLDGSDETDQGSSDQKSGDKGGPNTGGDSAKPHKTHTQPVKINPHDLMARAVRLPVPDANISSVAEAKGIVYYATSPSQTISGPLAGEKSELRAYDMKKRKHHTLVTDIKHFALSADGSTLFYKHEDQWTTRPASFSKDVSKDKKHHVNLAQAKRWMQPEAEWPTVYGEAMRHVRDYFLDPKLIHKIWPTIAARYHKLLGRAATRNDVNWLIANAMGTPSESHMYIRGGGTPYSKPANTTADLGGNYKLDESTGRYRISRIFRGDNTVPGYQSPLNQPGLKVAQGDYFLAINGQPLAAPTNPYKLLEGTYGSTISLKVADNAQGKNAHTILVKPRANAHKLHLLAWIRHNRQAVNKMSSGQIGYVYLENMEATGMKEFIRQYYSQRHKKAIIFDDRWNLGGFIDPMLFDRINRELTGMFINRYRSASPTPNVPMGYMAALINRGSASDGDIFAYMFKKDKLGPTIGTRTWAGVRGYSAPFHLLGGAGYQIVSENGMYGNDGQWNVENIGVFPDIRVRNKPGDLNAGQDAQMDKAVNVLMSKIKSKPKTYPQAPAWLPAFPPQPDYPKCGSKKVGDGACDWVNDNNG